MIRFKEGPVTDQQLIFFASELEFAAGHLKDCIDFSLTNHLVEARDALNSATIVFREVLNGYKKSQVVNPKLAMKAGDLCVYADQVLSLCSLHLRKSVTLLPQ